MSNPSTLDHRTPVDPSKSHRAMGGSPELKNLIVKNTQDASPKTLLYLAILNARLKMHGDMRALGVMDRDDITADANRVHGFIENVPDQTYTLEEALNFLPALKSEKARRHIIPQFLGSMIGFLEKRLHSEEELALLHKLDTLRLLSQQIRDTQDALRFAELTDHRQIMKTVTNLVA